MLARNMFRKVFGSRNDRMVRQLQQQVDKINQLEQQYKKLDDQDLAACTETLRQRYQQGETLDQLTTEAFGVVREASHRVLGMRHFDVQMIGGLVLHQGKIAEMRTGEGKTLMATLPVYLNALTGKGVHVVTVNEYLAQRDAQWMGELYRWLGLTVGVVLAEQEPEEKRAAYESDITYATNNELGFDYLRDNMAFSPEQRVQRDLHFAVVDEVDSILIDEARTPLIISGPAEQTAELYRKINQIVPKLTKQEEEEGDGDFSVEEKNKQIFLTEEGHQHVESLLEQAGLLQSEQSLYDASNLTLFHHLMACLRAHVLYHRNVDYIVRDGEVVIVDEFTGRTMPGRRWSDGLHQAIEAKERVKIQPENQTMASITFQNYFRLYERLSGMTGTADTEAFEFQQIYGLEVVVIPTHRPMVRDDRVDQVYLTQQEKFAAIVEDIKQSHAKEQPVLVGTTSIEVSELLAKQLRQQKIPHEVLNAKQHQREAQIIAQAGMPGAVTIATNMAGRGTDIVLGGNLQVELENLQNDGQEERQQQEKAWQTRHQAVLDAGGLYIIGTERHESRRIDNQLRGRAGRQGDPGASRFYLSLQDNLMRIFASERVSQLMQKLGMEQGESIEHPWVSRAIENAQRKVESHNFDIRKNLLEYDDVSNDQRKVVYSQRNDLLTSDTVQDTISDMRDEVLYDLFNRFIPAQSLPEQWQIEPLEQELKEQFDLDLPINQWLEQDDDLHEEPLKQRIAEAYDQRYQQREDLFGPELMRQLEKNLLMQVLDSHWKEHLAAMDYLRQGIHLRGYAQKNPKQEYKRESFDMFSAMLEAVRSETIRLLYRLQLQADAPPPPVAEQQAETELNFEHQSPQAPIAEPLDQPAPAEPAAAQPFVRPERKVGRNQPCPCGSGKKYKQCHGRLEA